MFLELNNLIQFCSVFGGKNRAKSRLYENDGVYYLMMDFQNSEEGKQAAQALINAEEFGGVVEQDLISECYLREHERCLIEERAVEKLREMDK